MSLNVKTRILFYSKRLSVYLVRYPEGHKVVPHVDMLSEGQLYKLNCVLVKPKAGGEFICEKTYSICLGESYSSGRTFTNTGFRRLSAATAGYSVLR